MDIERKREIDRDYAARHRTEARIRARECKARGRALINEIKATLSCVSCGGVYPPEATDFHHRDPTTKCTRVASMKTHTKERILAEIAKCDLLCANCHRERHQAQRGRTPGVYGTSHLRNIAIMDEAKSAPCIDCGESYAPAVMDFHHRDPTTKHSSLALMRGYSETRLREEIAKCDVLCANCHRRRHAVGGD